MRYQETEPDLPLSAAQLRWWVAQQLYPDIPNTVAMYLDLCGPLEVELMRDCGRRAAREIESPCVRVVSVDGAPRQQVLADADLEFTVRDLAGRPDPVAEALRGMEEDHFTPLDPRIDALTVAILYRVAPDRHLLYLRSHHLVLDGMGAVALLRRTGELYRAAVTGAEPEGPGGLDTAGLLAAEVAYRRSARVAADREYWLSALSGLAEPLGLAGHRAAPRTRPHRVSALLEPRTAGSIAVARTRHGATFGELLIAAFTCYFSRLTGNNDPVVALPVPARTTAVLRRSGGSVANVVPLRLTDIARGTVGAALTEVRAKVLAALRHQRYPYEDIQRDRGDGRVERGGFGPAINVLGFVEPMRLGPLTGHAQLLSSGPVEDLLVNVYQLGPDERTISIDFHGNPARYSAATLAWYHRGFLAYLDSFLTAAPGDLVARLEVPANATGSVAGLPESPRGQGLREGEPSAARTLLPELLRAGMRSVHPDAVAISDATRSLTYRQLDDLSRGWARKLTECGAGPGVPVAVVIPRSIESVLAIWAVATSGAYFVPIDPADPPDRIATVLTAGRIRWGLTVAGARPALSGADGVRVAGAGNGEVAGRMRWLELDGAAAAGSNGSGAAGRSVSGERYEPVVRPRESRDAAVDAGSYRGERAVFGPGPDGVPGADSGGCDGRSGPDSGVWLREVDAGEGKAGKRRVPWADLRPDHPAYLIHTSGTTGTPKGVVVGHRGLGMLAEYVVEHYGVRPDSVVLHAHSPAFDAHLLELLAAFAAGARLVVAPPGTAAGGQLADLIRSAGITHLLSTPAVLGTLDPGELPSLRVVVTGGETPSAELVRRWAPRMRLCNGYGPTEATVMTMQSDPLPPDDPVLVGPVLPGVRARLLDRRLQAVPVGGRGELYVGGPGVALGYLHDPVATAARFVADPAGTGQRLYRTGDLLRAGPGGYEYLGRVDRQLTVHGRRVEPGEIESALTACPEIAQAVVTVAGGPGSGARLVGYVVVAADHRFDPVVTLRRLRDVLPAALVPAVVIEIDRIPLTANGKLDRARLPEPVLPRAYRAPETDLQRLVAERIGRTVARTDIGLDDDFFALGGNSLLGVALSADLAEVTGVPVTVRWLFTAPTVADLADRIAGYRVSATSAAPSGQGPAVSGGDGTPAGPWAGPGAGEAVGSGLNGDTGGSDPPVTGPATDGGPEATTEGLEILLPLRRGGSRPPLFCFHSAVPLAWCYTGLSRWVEDRPVYGVQSPVLTSGEPDITTADALADRYVREILGVQPEGSYHLLGWSLGGQLAHAVAVRLRDLGRPVALLAMLDSVVFPEDSPPPPRPRMRDLLTHLLGDEPDADQVGRAPELTATAAAAQLAAAGATLGAGLTAGQLDRLHRAYISGVEISARYRPRVFDGDLLYFSATRGETELLDVRLWRPYIAGELIEHPVDAAHGQLTNPDIAAVIGPILARHLARLAEPVVDR
ncbi:AMP-binding protein [Nocardia sp. NPDC051750]|uniref:AMP-binding protein n=1 Tax=Nocardia sp. NPDC051750 TaxID=3364325 RepID=UPI00379BDA75